ncbi:MAG TPA: hypothetical protein VHZ32_09595 [Rhizomicrobium sp.]|nr:hypothetical protein [Rhizomicrobium sp.]
MLWNFEINRTGTMNLQSDQSIAVANRDINPSEQLADAYPELACLVRNEAVSAAFARYENMAVRWKRIYIFFGRLSLIAILLAMIIFDYQITLKNLYGAPDFLASLGALFAATGLISQTVIGLTHAKDRWQSARFGAERLRCFKFQLFTVLEEAPHPESLAPLVRQRTSEGIAALEVELMGGRASIMEFSPFHAIALPKKRPAHASRAVVESAVAIYDILRFSVESQHFEDKFHEHNRRAKFPSLLSEFSFGAGAILACIGILIAGLPQGWTISKILTASVYIDWLNFMTWLLFVLSAIIAIHERGSAHQQNAERYLTYSHEIRRIRANATSHIPASFFEAVRDMEHLMLREIQDFCRDVRHSNYIF